MGHGETGYPHVPSRRPGVTSHLFPRLTEGLGIGGAARHPAVGRFTGPLENALGRPAQDNRNARLLHRLGTYVYVVHVEEPAVVGNAGFGPEPPHQLQALIEPAHAAFNIHSHGFVFVVPPAQGDAQGHPAG